MYRCGGPREGFEVAIHPCGTPSHQNLVGGQETAGYSGRCGDKDVARSAVKIPVHILTIRTGIWQAGTKIEAEIIFEIGSRVVLRTVEENLQSSQTRLRSSNGVYRL